MIRKLFISFLHFDDIAALNHVSAFFVVAKATIRHAVKTGIQVRSLNIKNSLDSGFRRNNQRANLLAMHSQTAFRLSLF
jgi:hypothetical protein